MRFAKLNSTKENEHNLINEPIRQLVEKQAIIEYLHAIIKIDR